MAKGDKRAKAFRPPAATTGKTPKATPPAGSPQDETPHFCFRHADRRSRNPWVFKPQGADAEALFGFMRDMCQSPWKEILGQRTGNFTRHRKHHDQPVESIVQEAQDDYAAAKLDEVFGDDPIFRFRLTGEQRLWGFRRGRVFHVVWWDPNHLVYPTEPN